MFSFDVASDLEVEFNQPFFNQKATQNKTTILYGCDICPVVIDNICPANNIVLSILTNFGILQFYFENYDFVELEKMNHVLINVFIICSQNYKGNKPVFKDSEVHKEIPWSDAQQLAPPPTRNLKRMY